MIRKTFTDRIEATQYQDDIIAKEGVAVTGRLGEKFRVYAMTKERFEEMRSWRGENFTRGDAEWSLRKIALDAGDAIKNALTLQKSLESSDIYNDYETTIESARIMYNCRELETAKDVFHFIDDTHQYDKAMKQFIDETFQEYDYEAKQEVAKE